MFKAFGTKRLRNSDFLRVEGTEYSLSSTRGRETCDLIKKIGPCKHYLTDDHTLTHFREYWRSKFLNRLTTFEINDSSDDTIKDAQNYIREQLAKSKEKVIDEKIDMELKMILQHTPVYKRRT